MPANMFQVITGLILILGVTSPTTRAQTVPCGVQEIENTAGNGDSVLSKIVGGTLAVAGSWPWQVQLKAYGQHQCGGSILNNQWIITAAHCFNQYSFTFAWTVHAGSWRERTTDSTESTHRVSRIIRHSYYSVWSSDYDIALVKLSTPITFTSHRKPVCLPTVASQAVTPGTMCYVTGWGETSNTGHSGYLKQTYLPIVSATTCKLGHPGLISNNMICAGYSDTNVHRPCYGDSGGPLVCEDPTSGAWYLHGLVSWGDQYCNDPGKPGVFSSTIAYANWIQANMQ